MRILLTNDDGIHAPGLAALYPVLAEMGEVTVVAPQQVQSASGHAVTFNRPMAVEPVCVRAEDGSVLFDGYAVDGKPADCVKVALSAVLDDRPDLVVSGMNGGANIGMFTYYSGTVAAAREAVIHGLPAMAVSMHIGDHGRTRWALGAAQAGEAIGLAMGWVHEPGVIVNINVPITDEGRPPKGIRVVPMSCGTVPDEAAIARQEHRDGSFACQITDRTAFVSADPGTDVEGVLGGYVTITPLLLDPTCHRLTGQWSSRTTTGEAAR